MRVRRGLPWAGRSHPCGEWTKKRAFAGHIGAERRPLYVYCTVLSSPCTRWVRRVVAAIAFLASVCTPILARAEQSGLRWERDWHTGVNLRTDFGTHPARIDGGVRLRSWDLVLVVDPMVFLDDQHDLDALAHWHVADRWAVFGGWRATMIGILDGHQWQQKSLHGISAWLPELAGGHIRAVWGLEMAVLWVKHGGGLPTETISFSTARDWLDHVNFGMFVSVDYASAF